MMFSIKDFFIFCAVYQTLDLSLDQTWKTLPKLDLNVKIGKAVIK